jgi:type IV secretory pathway TrbD component
MVGGVLNIVYGIAAIGNSSFFVHNQKYVFSSLKGWGWTTLILGILEILASLSLFGGGAYGRWFAILVGALAAIGALLSIPAYPLWSIAVFGLSLWIIHGLVIYGESEPTSGS